MGWIPLYLVAGN